MDKFDREKFEEELKEMGIEYDPKGLSLWMRLLMRINPMLGIKIMNKRSGVNNDIFEKAHEVFSKVKRVDIFPLKGHHRGFIITLDEETALFFYQDGDHFKYDGWETGKYAKGKVTVFDNIPDKDMLSPYDLE